MQSGFRKFLIVLAATFFAWRSGAEIVFGAEGANVFLWQITSDSGGEVFLLGSIHDGTPDWYPLSETIEQAFEKSSSLTVELDNAKADREKVAKLVQEKGTYQADTISKHISKETYEKIISYIEKNKLPADKLTQFKPLLLSKILYEFESKKVGLDDAWGIDQHFIAKAGLSGKKILELETLDDQINVLFSADDDLQEKVLRATVEDFPEMKAQADKLFLAWQNGDSKSVETLMTPKHAEIRPFMTKLIDDRNVGMADKIEGYLKIKERHFVIVGAGHLVGDKSILKLLENKKYKIKQLGKSTATPSNEKN